MTNPGPLAYYRGEFLPATQIGIPLTDLGFVQGVTVAEQMRTFRGKLFRIERHWDRLFRSLEIIDVDPQITRAELTEIAERLVEANRPLQHEDDDLGLSCFITPGGYSTFASSGYAAPAGPTIGMHTYALPFHLWAAKYRTGESLCLTPIEQVSEHCWPVELKCRSRMHYYLADLAARRKFPGSRAVLCDSQGFVTEASTANLLAYFANEGIVSPPKEKILPGVTVAALLELAAAAGTHCSERDLTPDDLAQADEVLLCSTSPCVWSVTRFEAKSIGTGSPGPIAARLQAAWSTMVGFDIVEQAHRFAQRS